MKKLFKIALSSVGFLFFTLGILEISVRYVGSSFVQQQELLNERANKEASDLKIVCYGESTTAMGGTKSYPYLLEQELESILDIEVSVINRGMPGADTHILLSHLQADLELYKPDIVVTMMGANDVIGELVPLLRATPEKHSKKEYPLKSIDFLVYGVFNIDQSGGFWNTPLMLGITGRTYKFHPTNPQDINGYMEQLDVLDKAGDHDAADVLFAKILEEGTTDVVIARFARYYLEKGDVEKSDSLHKLAMSRRYKRERSMSRINYQHFCQILESNDVKFFAVQYPLQPLEPLKELLVDCKKVSLVDNKGVFEDALRQYDYDDLFWDHCYGDFGHATKLGNKILAKNIAKEISGVAK